MDIMLDPSIYSINALAYADSVVRSRKKNTDYWRETDELLTIPAVTTVRSATHTISRENTPPKPLPHRMRVMRPEEVERYPVYEAFPLSFLSVMSRYR